MPHHLAVLACFASGVIAAVYARGVVGCRRNGNGWPRSLLWPLIVLALLIFRPAL